MLTIVMLLVAPMDCRRSDASMAQAARLAQRGDDLAAENKFDEAVNVWRESTRYVPSAVRHRWGLDMVLLLCRLCVHEYIDSSCSCYMHHTTQILQEQIAQVLLEQEKYFPAVRAATEATKLNPTWSTVRSAWSSL